MTAIKIVSETKDTVTVNRRDWVRLLAELEDAEDRAAVREGRATEAALGKAAIRENSLSGDEARRLLDGESPVRLWREKRGLSQRALAAVAGVAPGYLADIENGRKPGSADTLSRLARALDISMDDLMDEQQRQRAPEFGPVWLRSRPHSPGIGPGGRGASPLEQRYDSVRDACEAVHREWPTLRSQSPEIVDERRLPIFSVEDLWRKMEPEFFEPEREPAPFDIAFDQVALWSGKLSSYVLWATVDDEPVRCRVLEEVFRECLDEPHANVKDFPRMFQRNRQKIERAFRAAIQSGRFSSWPDRDAGRIRREIVLSRNDFYILASARS